MENWISRNTSRGTGDVVEAVPVEHPLHRAVVALQPFYRGVLPKPALGYWRTFQNLAWTNKEDAEDEAKSLVEWVKDEILSHNAEQQALHNQPEVNPTTNGATQPPTAALASVGAPPSEAGRDNESGSKYDALYQSFLNLAWTNKESAEDEAKPLVESEKDHTESHNAEQQTLHNQPEVDSTTNGATQPPVFNFVVVNVPPSEAGRDNESGSKYDALDQSSLNPDWTNKESAEDEAKSFVEGGKDHTESHNAEQQIDHNQAEIETTGDLCEASDNGKSSAVVMTAETPKQFKPPTERADGKTTRRLLNVYTDGLADERLEQAADILKHDKMTVNDKLWKIDALMPIPPTVSTPKLGSLLQVSKTAVQHTSWYKQNRKGRNASAIDRRHEQHRQRKQQYEPEPSSDDD